MQSSDPKSMGYAGAKELNPGNGFLGGSGSSFHASSIKIAFKHGNCRNGLASLIPECMNPIWSHNEAAAQDLEFLFAMLSHSVTPSDQPATHPKLLQLAHPMGTLLLLLVGCEASVLNGRFCLRFVLLYCPQLFLPHSHGGLLLITLSGKIPLIWYTQGKMQAMSPSFRWRQ